MKLTAKRKQILELLQKTTEPMSATAIHECLSDIDLVTVYRNLDLFVQQGVVKRLQFDDEALYEFQAQPHHHAICDTCNKMIHFSVPEEKLGELVHIPNFAVQSIDITVKGVCTHEKA